MKEVFRGRARTFIPASKGSLYLELKTRTSSESVDKIVHAGKVIGVSNSHEVWLLIIGTKSE